MPPRVAMEPVQPGQIEIVESDWLTARNNGRTLGEEAGVAPDPRWQSLCWTGENDIATLHFDDVSGIPFLDDIAGVEEYQHRARLRAGDGDLLATATQPAAGYEAYCQETLGLGAPGLVHPETSGRLLEVARGCAEGPVFEQICAHARSHRGLAIEPFMGIEAVWELAASVQQAAEVDVEVIAPPPDVTWWANDKALFERVVATTVGSEWLVESRCCSTVEEVTDALVFFSAKNHRVAIKRLRCASAMGNLVLDGEDLHRQSQAAIHETARVFLERTLWDGQEEVLVVVWEDAALSPSTQLLIPPVSLGPPRLDGVYEQILEGSEGVFVGSRPAELPPSVLERLGSAALRVASALQGMGYVGRCSFDHLMIGEGAAEPRLLFVECNGRWGGTSTPMSLVDRLLGTPRPLYRAQDVVAEALVGRPFNDILAAVGDALWNVERGSGRYIFYNVGPLEHSGKLDAIVIGDSREDVDQAAHDLFGLLGLEAPGA